MKMHSRCISCIVKKQELKVRNCIGVDENKRLEYMRKVLNILAAGNDETMPWLSTKIDTLFYSMFSDTLDYATIKTHYNEMMLTQQEALQKSINNSKDPLYYALQLARVGNYIDYGALDNVENHLLKELLNNAAQDRLAEDEYTYFKKDLQKAQYLLYICDNCGEIVLDKLLIQLLLKLYPHLTIKVMVRGGEVINDATRIDAKQIGLETICEVIDSGIAMAGTDLKHISKEALSAIETADIIISKGQANFETLFANQYPVYYLLLCKCDLFVSRFQMKKFQGIFIKEDRIVTHI